MLNSIVKPNIRTSRIAYLVMVFTLAVVLPVHAQISSLTIADSMEANGDYAGAGRAYLNLLNSTSDTLSPKQKPVVARKALICLSKATDDYLIRHSGEFRHCVAFDCLDNAYNQLITIEPNDPAWLYLKAKYLCVNNKYADATKLLKQAVKTTRGQDSVRKKSQKLMDAIQHITAKGIANPRIPSGTNISNTISFGSSEKRLDEADQYDVPQLDRIILRSGI